MRAAWRRREAIEGYLFLAPAVLIIGAFHVWPALYVFYMSLFRWDILQGAFLGFRNYEHLLQDAVSKYGSEAEAARWVATPNTSAHVSGDAVDIGPFDATAWLSEHGAKYGLCQIYSNEPWHYELRPEAIGHGCPPMYADPTHAPRDAAMTSTLGIEPVSTQSPHAGRKHE